MNLLTIDEQSIRTVGDLYSLNDLHKASGGSPKHRPNQFLRNEQTQALIAEIDRCANSRIAVKTKRGGELQGTYVCEEVVTAYAMWINAAFALKVIRTFKAKQAPQTLPSQLSTVEDRRPLVAAVNLWVMKNIKMSYSDANTMIHQRFGVEHTSELTKAQVLEAVEYVHQMMSGSSRVSSQPPARQLTSGEFLSDFPRQIEAGNSYPVEVLMPIYWAIHKRTQGTSQMMIERKRMTDLMRDMKVMEQNMNRLWTRMDYLAVMPSDLTESNWQRQAITM